MSNAVEAIERSYRAYFTAFAHVSAREIGAYYHVPCVFMSSAGVFVLATPDETERFFERMLLSLRARGYARSELQTLQIKQLGADLALLNVRGARYKADGSLLEPLSAIYQLRNVEDRWLIASATVYESARALDLA